MYHGNNLPVQITCQPHWGDHGRIVARGQPGAPLGIDKFSDMANDDAAAATFAGRCAVGVYLAGTAGTGRLSSTTTADLSSPFQCNGAWARPFPAGASASWHPGAVRAAGDACDGASHSDHELRPSRGSTRAGQRDTADDQADQPQHHGQDRPGLPGSATNLTARGGQMRQPDGRAYQ